MTSWFLRATSENPANRISAFAPIYLSILALLAVAHSYRGASHEDGSWHVWMLALLLQLPLAAYFLFTSRHEFRRAKPIVVTQVILWSLGLIAGAFQPAWS